MAHAGMNTGAVAFELRIALSTVEYHLARGELQPPPPPEAPLPMPADPLRESTRVRVARLLGAGLTRTDIARELGVTIGTVSYHAKRLGSAVDERAARRYDWSEVQRYYDTGLSMRQCRARFGFSSGSWHDAVQRGALHPRPSETPLEHLFVASSRRDRGNLKRRLFEAGLKEPRCETCGLDNWRGAPISLQLHHVNGDRFDNRIDNLQVLCPNCHSVTGNHGGRRKRPAAQADDAAD